MSDPGTKEDLLIFLFFYTLVIYHVFTSRSNKCTSKPLFFSQTLPLIEFGLPPPPYLINIPRNQFFTCYFSEAWTLNYFRMILVLVGSSTPPTHIHSSRRSIIISAHAYNNYTGHSITILCMCQLKFNICIKKKGEGSIKRQIPSWWRLSNLSIKQT